MKLWDKDAERGMLLGSLAAIILYTIFPSPDYDLSVAYPGNPPYGTLWYFLNPFYWTTHLYAFWLFGVWATVTGIEYWMVKKGMIDARLVNLQVFTTAILYGLHAYQDVTVIMFAPMAMLSPFFQILLLEQKIPLPFTPQWTCAFNGTANVGDIATNPCLNNSLKVAGWTHVYAFTYLILALWVILPVILWWKRRSLMKKLDKQYEEAHKDCDSPCCGSCPMNAPYGEDTC